MLRTLGVQPALGRDFSQSDDTPAANGTVLLSWGLWKRRFGGDPAILNRTIYLDAQPYTVIGVMPAWFDFPDPSVQLWTPVYHDKPEETMTSFSDHMFRVVGRLKPGVSATQGVADLSIISQQIHAVPKYKAGLGYAIHVDGAPEMSYAVTDGSYGANGASGGIIWMDPSLQLIRIYLTHYFLGDFRDRNTVMNAAFPG